jgi:hypothetical protein
MLQQQRSVGGCHQVVRDAKPCRKRQPIEWRPRRSCPARWEVITRSHLVTHMAIGRPPDAGGESPMAISLARQMSYWRMADMPAWGCLATELRTASLLNFIRTDKEILISLSVTCDPEDGH